MTSRTAAARYAKALLDVASKEADIEKVGQELDAFNAMIRQHAALDRVLTNPAVPAPRKRAAIGELTKLAGVSPIVSKLLVLLAERDRLVLLNDLSSIYRDILMDRQNVVRAEVITSTPLAADKTQAIEKVWPPSPARKCRWSPKWTRTSSGESSLGLAARSTMPASRPN